MKNLKTLLGSKLILAGPAAGPAPRSGGHAFYYDIHAGCRPFPAMKFKTLMVIKAVVCLGFGPLLLLVPGPLLTILGSSYGPGAAITAREYGAALLGNFMLTWYARNAEASVARRAIIWDLFVYDAIALVAMLLIQLAGGMNLHGWGIVAIYLFFAIGFGSFLLPGRRIA